MSVLIDGICYLLNSPRAKQATVDNNQSITEADVIILSVIKISLNLHYSVVAVSSNAFQSNASITSVTLPDGVTSIGSNAFNSCSSLKTVYFNQNPIPIQSYNGQFANISPNATAYYLDGTDITQLRNQGWFANYVVSNPPPYPCFKEDSLILTDKGYKPVQDLRTGDLVKTLLNGFLPIDMIGKRDIVHSANVEDRIKDQLYKCSQTEYPDIFEPLVLTGCHSILVDKFASKEQRAKTIEVNGDTFFTDNKLRLPVCADERATVYEIPGTYTIYHLALKNPDYYMNYGIYANGLLVESCSKRYLKELSNMELIH
jgi:BspA type Leucine rich repeat region (6 copies)/Hint domain